MSDPFLPRLGGILSADIAVPEHERELRFYSRVPTTGKNLLKRKRVRNGRPHQERRPARPLGAGAPSRRDHSQVQPRWRSAG